MATVRDLQRSKKDDPQDISKITKLRITTDKKRSNIIVYPEIYLNKRWQPLVHNQKCLVTKTSSMVGSIQGHRIRELRRQWEEWLKDWIKANKLKIKIEKLKPPEEIKETKPTVQKWLKEWKLWANSGIDVERPRSAHHWRSIKSKFLSLSSSSASDNDVELEPTTDDFSDSTL